MGIFGALLWILGGSQFSMPINAQNVSILSGVILTTALGQLCFFWAAAEIEASRLSSLTGLKVVVVALICTIIGRDSFDAMQWAAVLLCAFAALGMNFSGLKISGTGAFWLGMMLIFYSICDILIKLLVGVFQGSSILVASFGSVAVIYAFVGLIALVLFLFIKKDYSLFKDALPYAATWFVAMLLLYFCFSFLSVVFVNIIIALRGIISVFMGAAISKLGYTRVEPKTDKRIWIRRFIMASLMVLATAMYSYSSIN